MFQSKNKIVYFCLVSLIIFVSISACDTYTGNSTSIKYNEMYSSKPYFETNTDSVEHYPTASSDNTTNQDDNFFNTSGVSNTPGISNTASPVQSGSIATTESSSATHTAISTGSPTPIHSSGGSITSSPSAPATSTASQTSTSGTTAASSKSPNMTETPTSTSTPVMTPMPSNYYLLTVNSAMGGRAYIETPLLNENITVYGFKEGTLVRVCAVPDDNWIFVGWFIGDDKVSDDIFFHTYMPSSDYTLTAQFAL